MIEGTFVDDSSKTTEVPNWLTIGGLAVGAILFLLYLNASEDLKDSERYRRFEKYLNECGCRHVGDTTDYEGYSTNEYICYVGGGYTTYRDFSETIDGIVGPQDSFRRLCPTP